MQRSAPTVLHAHCPRREGEGGGGHLCVRGGGGGGFVGEWGGGGGPVGVEGECFPHNIVS